MYSLTWYYIHTYRIYRLEYSLYTYITHVYTYMYVYIHLYMCIFVCFKLCTHTTINYSFLQLIA